VIADALAACADRLGADATAVLARLAGPIGDAARVAARELAALDEPARKRRRAELAAQLRSPVPVQLRGVHASWVEIVLAELPGRARTAIAGESITPIDVWLGRWATSSFPFPGNDLVVREPLAWLSSIAHDQLAFALQDAAPPLLADARARIARTPRRDALGPHRLALVRCRGAVLDDPASLVAIAGRALAPHVAANTLACLALTRRLPYVLGLVLERELAANAATPLDDAPTWDALVAPV